MKLDFREAPEILTGIVDAMAVGVFTVDAKGRFVAWSEGAERITGFSGEEVLGKPCDLLEGPNCKGFATLAELLGPRRPRAERHLQPRMQADEPGWPRSLHPRKRTPDLGRGSEDRRRRGSFTDVSSLVLANEKIAVLSKQAATGYAFEELIGNSDTMREVFRQLKLAADSDVACS